MRVTVLGSGQWGTSIAQILCDAGNDVLIWGRNQGVIDEINQNHRNSRSLPGIDLPKSLRATSSLQEAFDHAEMIVLAVPAQTLRENLTQWKSYFSLEVPIVSTLKGIEVSTQLRMSEVIQEVLGISEKKIAILTGPNLAKEVVLRQPAGAVAASTSQGQAEDTQVKSFKALNNT